MGFSVSTVSLVLLLPLAMVTGQAPEESQNAVEKLQVQVYYETKCPDSMSFLRNQLQPSMREKNRMQYTDLELIPFGKAIVWRDATTKKLHVQCQHGEPECVDNALHACILETSDFEVAFDVIVCLMGSYTTELQKCSEKYNLNLDPVNECVANRSTAEILEKYGRQTAEIDLTFVPSIALNGKFDYSEQNHLLYRFDAKFCNAYEIKHGKKLENCH